MELVYLLIVFVLLWNRYQCSGCWEFHAEQQLLIRRLLCPTLWTILRSTFLGQNCTAFLLLLMLEMSFSFCLSYLMFMYVLKDDLKCVKAGWTEDSKTPLFLYKNELTSRLCSVFILDAIKHLLTNNLTIRSMWLLWSFQLFHMIFRFPVFEHFKGFSSVLV